MPDTITDFDKFVFAGCTALKKINIPKGLKDLGYMTFIGSGLEEITLPGTLEDAEYVTPAYSNRYLPNLGLFQRSGNNKRVQQWYSPVIFELEMGGVL